MNSFMNEDVMWERLKDLQLEAENRRAHGTRLVAAVRALAQRAWLLAGLAARRAPRRHPAHYRRRTS